MCTLFVGEDDEHKFSVHENQLLKSPRFQSITEDERYAINKEIGLGDSDPNVISLLLEYLYAGDYGPKLGDEISECWTADVIDRLAQAKLQTGLYFEAEVNELSDLSRLVVKKIEMLALSLGSFLSVAQVIYGLFDEALFPNIGFFQDFFLSRDEGASA